MHLRAYIHLLFHNLQKENTEHVSQLINMIRRVMEGERPPEGFMQFWLALILAYIRSSSLPLRLFAWDHMNDLVDTARRARPPARYVFVYLCM